MKKAVSLGVLALFAVSAAGCGRMADLDAPPAKQTERSPRGAQAPGLPEPGTVYRPPSTQPIDGGPTSPYNGPGAQPNR
jgi:predicted small lipoprotein YifL